MQLYLLGIHYKNANYKEKDITGFRIIDADTGEISDQPYNAVYNVVSGTVAKISGLGYRSNNKRVVSLYNSFDKYPAWVGGVPTRNGFIVTKVTVGENNVCGYRLIDMNGQAKTVDSNTLANFVNSNVVGNVSIDITGFILPNDIKRESAIRKLTSAENMENKKKLIQQDAEYAKQLTKPKKPRKLGRAADDPRYPRLITGVPNNPSRVKEVDPNTGMTVEQKMVYVILAMKKIKPFYYSVFSMLKRVEASPRDNVERFAVSLDTFYFNSDCVLKCTLPELLFIVLHETMHIGMKHAVRKGGKEHDAWNYACDYYINKVIAQEFNILEPNIAYSAGNSIDGYKIAIPDWVLYNENVSVEKDSPEKLYEELIDTLRDNKEQSNGNEGSGEGSDSNSDGQCNSGNNGQENKLNGGSGEQPEDNKDNKDQNEQNGANGTDKNATSGSESESESDNNSSDGNNGSRSKDPRKQGRLIGKMFRGQQIPNTETDIVNDPNSNGMTAEQQNQVANTVLNRAIVTHKQSHRFGGDNADFFERYIEEMMAPKINWVSLLNNYLIKATQKINTFMAPDKRFRQRGMILPGPKRLNDDHLGHILVCIDTSGSISDKDLGMAFNQISNLLKTYKVDADLIYWDTRVRAVYPFKEVEDILHKKPLGGGGTDANCIYEYIENNKDYKVGIKQKPNVILIFTDGCIPNMEDKYYKYKDTIWIVNENPKWKAPFGKTAPLKVER